MFKGRRLLIATKHRKETVLAPLFEEGLGVQSVVPENFNTDIFGTFSGEVERKEGPVTMVRNKCLEALSVYGCDLGIASEGSFGSHPSIPFIHADEEIVIFIDKKNDLEIIAKKLEIETNFSAEEIKTWKELVDFAQRGKFPSHALILRSSEKNTKAIFKGITDWDLLKIQYEELRKSTETVFVETDMRALYNPTRMQSNLLYKCNWSPFFGEEFGSRVTHTLVNGKLVYEDGKIFNNKKGQRLLFEKLR